MRPRLKMRLTSLDVAQTVVDLLSQDTAVHLPYNVPSVDRKRQRIGKQCHTDCTPTSPTLMIGCLPMVIYFVFGEREKSLLFLMARRRGEKQQHQQQTSCFLFFLSVSFQLQSHFSHRIVPGDPCRVCGFEKNTGRNFGVITCSTCKAFFRRNGRTGSVSRSRRRAHLDHHAVLFRLFHRAVSEVNVL